MFKKLKNLMSGGDKSREQHMSDKEKATKQGKLVRVIDVKFDEKNHDGYLN